MKSRYVIKYTKIIFDQDIDKRVFKLIYFKCPRSMGECAQKMRNDPLVTSINLIDSSQSPFKIKPP